MTYFSKLFFLPKAAKDKQACRQQSLNAYGNKFQFSDASQTRKKSGILTFYVNRFYYFSLFFTRSVAAKVQLQINIHFISLNLATHKLYYIRTYISQERFGVSVWRRLRC